MHTNLTALFEMIAVPFFLILALKRVSHGCKQLIANRYGIRGQLFFGWLGIVIHEFSHLVIAVLFGHHITGFKLLHVPRGGDDNQLGYVNHTFNQKNGYQRTGNLFIGIAPVLGCAISLILFTKLLAPELITSLSRLPDWHFPTAILALASIWKFILLILIASSISIGGFDLSHADLSNIKFGLLVVAILVVVSASFATVLGVAVNYLNWVHSICIIVNGVLTLSLVVTVLSNGVIRLITDH
ncbi:hypothetical protein [Nicoliella spurrieriana]|uniref:hypothetical protein n=1 Tax=Nicoliella spurrieriana TaxID=2925830 RepID=UPI0021A3A4DF|nr:hypothetical protein [Nicoliella spurrieriana]